MLIMNIPNFINSNFLQNLNQRTKSKSALSQKLMKFGYIVCTMSSVTENDIFKSLASYFCDVIKITYPTRHVYNVRKRRCMALFCLCCAVVL